MGSFLGFLSKRPFLSGVALSLVLVVGAELCKAYQGWRVSQAAEACQAESKRELDANKKKPDPDGWENLGLLCDGKLLYQESFASDWKEPPGVQGELYRAYTDSLYRSESSTLYGLAFLALFLGSLPSIWRFFLRRLSEIAMAVKGNVD